MLFYLRARSKKRLRLDFGRLLPRWSSFAAAQKLSRLEHSIRKWCGRPWKIQTFDKDQLEEPALEVGPGQVWSVQFHENLIVEKECLVFRYFVKIKSLLNFSSLYCLLSPIVFVNMLLDLLPIVLMMSWLLYCAWWYRIADIRKVFRLRRVIVAISHFSRTPLSQFFAEGFILLLLLSLHLLHSSSLLLHGIVLHGLGFLYLLLHQTLFLFSSYLNFAQVFCHFMYFFLLYSSFSTFCAMEIPRWKVSSMGLFYNLLEYFFVFYFFSEFFILTISFFLHFLIM